MAILETHGLRKVYGSGDTEVRALDGVDLAVEKGEFAAVVGTSGSGKSTLLHMLGGLDRPTGGSVIVDGRDLSTLKDEELTIFRRRKIGFVGSIWSASSVMERYLGYQRALRTAGIVPREEWLLEDRDAGGHFLPLRLPEELPEAFLCSCDEAACNLMDTLRRAGVRVPEDVAVCGYGGFRFAARCTPALTTYQVNVEQMASAAVSRLYRKIRREPMAPMIWTVPGRLVVRESTGPAER